MRLTNAKIQGLKPEESVRRVPDGGGLVLEVTPHGKKVFRLRYRDKSSREVWRTLGNFPELSLKEARSLREEIKTLAKMGKPIDEPEPELEQSEDATLWCTVVDEYLNKREDDGAAWRTIKKLRYQLEVVKAELGGRDIKSIRAPDVLAVVEPIAADGRNETAHEVRTRFSQVFRFAVARGYVDSDPASYVIDGMVKRKRGEFKGVTEPDQVGKLMRAIRGNTPLLLSAYLFPRNTELRGMKWVEIDWDRGLWEVPGERMKMKRDHLVPLPRQALSLLRGLPRTNDLVLPSPRGGMFSDAAFNASLRRLGYGRDQHVHHGFRTTASTNLNEMGFNRDWVERQLAHVEANKVRGAYNKAEYLEGRVEMMQSYADWLDKISSSVTNKFP